MDIHRMVNNFDTTSKCYRILVIIAVILIIVILWMKHLISQDETSPLSDTIPTQAGMIKKSHSKANISLTKKETISPIFLLIKPVMALLVEK